MLIKDREPVARNHCETISLSVQAVGSLIGELRSKAIEQSRKFDAFTAKLNG